MVATIPTACLIPGYQLQELISTGGFGAVYRALDASSGETVAIKVGQIAENPNTPEFRAQLQRDFENEWASLNRIRSDRIVRPIARGTTVDEKPYLVLEHVPGVTLNDFRISVESGFLPFDVRQTSILMLGAVEAVGVLHESDLIHNDVKLSNFIVMEDGAVKLCDLGMAKSIQEARKAGSRPYRGTPRYIPVQTVETPQKDVYALGVAFYHLLTGREISPSSHPLASLFPPPPPSQTRPERGIARPVDRVVMKAIHRAPTSRYADANEMAEDLRAIAIPPKTLKRPARRR
ncbi:MAG TPA: serine/threonine-protein kinase [bacterium]|nr:serine/threonine-protein kinase [bacterium]